MPLMLALGVAIAVALGLLAARTRLAPRSLWHQRLRQFHPHAPRAAGAAASPASVYQSIRAAVGALRRREAMEQQLEQALTVMAAALQAGGSLVQALQAAAREIPAPLGGELERCLFEYQAGSPFDDALERLRQRISSPYGDQWAAVLEVQRESGGNLAAALAGLAQGLVQRRLLRGEMEARTAEARGAAHLLALLPPGLVAYLAFAYPQLLEPLFSHPLGQAGALYALMSWAAGVALARRLTDFRHLGG